MSPVMVKWLDVLATDPEVPSSIPTLAQAGAGDNASLQYD